MTLPLTKDTLRAAYDYLRTTPPFRQWKLPPGHEVKFQVVRNPKVFADYLWNGHHVIRVSSQSVGYGGTLIETMAHEMIHLYERAAGLATSSEHSKNFWKLAARVCKHHGFDPKAF